MNTKQQRRCVCCRKTEHQTNMIRIAKFQNQIYIDKNHSPNGRGAYICNNIDCIKNVIKKRLLNRAFKMNLDVEIYNQLGEYEQDN